MIWGLRKTTQYRFGVLLVTVVSIMFIITVWLNFRLLTSDKCTQYSPQEVIRYVQKTKPGNKPLNAKHRLAVIVPFRDRFEELLEFAPYIHNFLNAQNVYHDIFILNQVDQFRFNRASLINVGYLLTSADYDYMVMHDVDLLPLNKNLTYKYPEQPLHLAAPNLHPRYNYSKFIGGILLINRQHFKQVNGLSNRYWGWGLEDDEFYVRLKDANLTVNRPDNISTGVNNTFRHIHGKNRKRDTVKCYNQREVTRRRDRQTGLHDVNYKVISQKRMEIEGAPLTVYNIQLFCNKDATPWCDCSSDKKA